MHEASLCDALFDLVDRQVAHNLADHAGGVVRLIRVSVGELAGVDPELFQIAFDTLRIDRQPRAELELVLVPASWRCALCDHTRAPDAPLTCPHCEAPLRLYEGGELTLERLELEVRD